MLTRPARAHVGPPPPGLQAESLRIPYGDGQHLAGWFLPGRSGQGAVLLQHGVRGNRLQMLARARWLQREGIASLTVDLPAHGESSGERITFGRHEARGTEAAMAWLRTRLPGEKVGAIGVSLGGASLLFAQRQPELDWVAPLLLVQLPLRLGIDAEQLRPIDAVAGVRAPLLIASGTLDLHTRWPETERLFAAAVEPKALWPVQGAAHVDLHGFDPAAYEARLLPWLQSHLRKSPP
jgi:fermentation-respiration switch protein FrsA (DUF1100 family)